LVRCRNGNKPNAIKLKHDDGRSAAGMRRAKRTLAARGNYGGSQIVVSFTHGDGGSEAGMRRAKQQTLAKRTA
jgi:hypothetical protein